MPDLILYDLTTSKESLTNFLVVATTFLVAKACHDERSPGWLSVGALIASLHLGSV